MWASGLDASGLRERLFVLQRESFWDPGLPVGGLLRGHKFAHVLEEILSELGVDRIEAAPVPFAVETPETGS